MTNLEKEFFVLIVDYQEYFQGYENTLKDLTNCKFLFSDDYSVQKELIEQRKFDAILINIKLFSERQQPDLSIIKKQFKEFNIPTFFFRHKSGQEVDIELILNTSINLADTVLFNDLVLSIKTHNRNDEISTSVSLNSNNRSDSENKKRELLDNHEINQFKAVFIRNITYEIRSLLNNVGGPIQLIKEKIDDHELIPFFNIIDSTLNRLVEFTSKATITADLKLGNYPIKKVLVNLDEIFRFAALELTEVIEMEKIKLTLNPAHSKFSIYGDKDLLFHSFTAILDKIINLTKENSEIIVDFLAENGKIDCRIKNNGITLKEQDLLEIFNSTSIDQEIGLALAKSVLEIHDGFYWIDLSKGSGSTIGISFKTNNHE